jgi:hypothetical protein
MKVVEVLCETDPEGIPAYDPEETPARVKLLEGLGQ